MRLQTLGRRSRWGDIKTAVHQSCSGCIMKSFAVEPFAGVVVRGCIVPDRRPDRGDQSRGAGASQLSGISERTCMGPTSHYPDPKKRLGLL